MLSSIRISPFTTATTTPLFTRPTIATTPKTTPTTSPEIVTDVSDFVTAVTEEEVTFESTSQQATTEDQIADDGVNVALIAGISSGLVVLVLAVIIVASIVCYKKRHKKPYDGSRRPTMLPTVEEIDNITKQHGNESENRGDAREDTRNNAENKTTKTIKNMTKSTPSIHVTYDDDGSSMTQFVPPSLEKNTNNDTNSDDGNEIYDHPKPTFPPRKQHESPVYENHLPKPHTQTQKPWKHGYVNTPAAPHGQYNQSQANSESDNDASFHEHDYVNKEAVEKMAEQAKANRQIFTNTTDENGNESPYANTAFHTMPHAKREDEDNIKPAVSMDNLQRPKVAPRPPIKKKRASKLNQFQDVGMMMNESEFGGNRVS